MARSELKPENILCLNDGNKYRILDVMSKDGGSCLVYKAIRLPSETQPLSTNFVIKEFFPKDNSLAKHILRGENGELVIAEKSIKLFNKKKERFINGIAKQVAFYDDDSNHAMMGYPDVYNNVNGTAYSVLGLTNGVTL